MGDHVPDGSDECATAPDLTTQDRRWRRGSGGVRPVDEGSELGFGSGMTCWRRLRDWNDAGVWHRLHESLLAELHAAGALDCSKALIDGSHVRAMKGGPKPDRARSTVPEQARSTI